MDKSDLKQLEATRRLRQELARLEENEQVKKLDTMLSEIEQIRVRNAVSVDDFTEILHTTYKRAKTPSTPAEMVSVNVDGHVEQWPSKRQGRLPPKITTLINKHGAKNYEALVNKLRVKAKGSNVAKLK